MFKQLKKITLVVLGLYVVIAVYHVWMNIGFNALGFGGKKNVAEARFRVGFLPVTLTCPVTDWINKNMVGKGAADL